jgi:hypothetical protein
VVRTYGNGVMRPKVTSTNPPTHQPINSTAPFHVPFPPVQVGLRSSLSSRSQGGTAKESWDEGVGSS